MDDLPSDAPRPRHCHLRKWSDFNGYGFNLHAERGKAGQYIGTVDDNSPAVAAGLLAGDRIIEVNGTNIGSENHQQVVQRIKAVANETKLLVVDADTDAYYKERKMVVRGDMPNVDYRESPTDNPYTNSADETANIDNEMHSMTVADNVIEAGFEPRLSRLVIWPDFVGYGFNLHADRATPGQFIGKVDESSPAEAGGLKPDDRIIEVNGVSVSGKSHAEVVAEIKSNPGRVSLLVVDMSTDDYCRSHGIEVTGSMSNIKTISCPEERTVSVQVNGDGGQVVSTSNDHIDSTETNDMQGENVMDDYLNDYEEDVPEKRTDDDVDDDVDQPCSPSYSDFQEMQKEPEPVAARPPSPPTSMTSSVNTDPPQPSGKAVVVGGLEFAGSAKEARERMKKKGNVKQDASLSLRDKYELLQKM